MIIIGVDTSLRSTGYGVIETEGHRLKFRDCGTIVNRSAAPLTSCLKAIYEKIALLIVTHRPDVIAVESVIYGKNAGTMLLLGEARGAVLTAAVRRGVPVYEYEPRRMKKAICGNGLAEKVQIQRMVKTLLNLRELPQNDAADALGLAICHAHSHSLIAAAAPI